MIVDDGEEFPASASRLLGSQGMDVVALATSGDHALQLAGTLGPELALVDIELVARPGDAGGPS